MRSHEARRNFNDQIEVRLQTREHPEGMDAAWDEHIMIVKETAQAEFGEPRRFTQE